MKISREQVEHIAMLARLGLSEAEIERFCGQLGQILEHAGKISEADLTDVEPTAHAVRMRNVLREDVVKECLPRDKALSNAPEQEDGYFLIPKIV